MVSFTARPFIHTLTFAVALSGCAGASSSNQALSYFSAPQIAAQPAAHLYGNDWVTSSRPSDNDIVVYKRRSKDLMLKIDETLTSGLSAPMGMVATPGGRLYVANSGDSNVLVYRTSSKGPRGPVATLSDDGAVPVNVDVTPNRRLVAVSNGVTTASGAGSVSVYLNRQDEPSRALRYGRHPIQGEGIAIDSNGNCYWGFNDPKTLTGSIVKFASCRGRGTPIVSGIMKTGGLAFDQSQNLYYVDQLAGIYKCTGLSQCTVIAAVGCSDCLVAPTNINFDNKTPQNLWVADAAGYIDALNSSGTIEYRLEAVGGAADPPIGIAPSPGS